MAISASKTTVVSSSSDNSTYNPVAGIKTAKITINGNTLDTSSFANNAGYMQRSLQGLKSFTITMSGDWDPADSPQNLFRTSLTTFTTSCYARILPDGTNGWKGPVVVQNFDVDAPVNGIATFSCTLESNGAVTIV